jgi:hypothetical protein
LGAHGESDVQLAERLRAGLAASDDHVWAVFDAVEDELGRATAVGRQEMALRMVENLQNLASHPGSGVDVAALRARLGPETAKLWDQVDAYWAKVHDWHAKVGTVAAPVAPLHVYSVDHPEVRAEVLAGYRTFADGRVIGLADVVRYATATGDAFSLTGAEPVRRRRFWRGPGRGSG